MDFPEGHHPFAEGQHHFAEGQHLHMSERKKTSNISSEGQKRV